MKIVISTFYNAGILNVFLNYRGDLIKTMKEHGHEVIVAGSEPDEGNKLQRILDIRYFCIPFNRAGVGIFENIFLIYRLVKFLKIEKPDVFLGYSNKPIIYGTIASTLVKIKYKYAVVTGLGNVFSKHDFKTKIVRFIVSKLYKIAMPLCDCVMFQNKDDCKECIERKFINKTKTAVVNGSGINIFHFEVQPPSNDMIFLMISRLVKEKGIMEYLQAAKKVSENYPSVKFKLLCSFTCGVNFDNIKPFLSKNIEYIEEVADVRPYLRACSVFVFPSYYREGVPRVVLEAMATGRAIITTDAPGCRETVKHKYNGLLVPVQNTEALESAMLWMIENPDKISEMGKNSRRYCQEKFDIRKVNKDMIYYMGLK